VAIPDPREEVPHFADWEEAALVSGASPLPRAPADGRAFYIGLI